MTSFLAKAFQKQPFSSNEDSEVEKVYSPDNPTIAAQTEGEPLKLCGYLEKRGGPTNPAFKKRFIVLTEHGNMRYFKNDSSTAKLGGFSVINAEVDATGTTNILKINTEDRDWVLKFANEAMRAKWVFAIQSVLNGQYVNDLQSMNGYGLKQVIERLTHQYTTLSQTARLPTILPVDSTRMTHEPRRSIVGGVRKGHGSNEFTYTIPQLLEIQRVDIPKDNHTLLTPKVDIPLSTEQVKVACVTWNLAEYLPDLKELDFLKQIADPADKDLAPSIFVVGVQECQPVMYNLTDATQESLAPVEIWRAMVQSVIGRDYCMIANRVMGAIQITVFAKAEVIYGISHLSLSHVPCGIGNVMANKGGVGVSFKIYGTSFAFVAAHLPAHQNKVLERNAAFHRIDYLLSNALLGNIVSSDEAAPALPPGQTHLGNAFDYVLFMGDFNYRMDFPDYKRLMQMLNVIKASEVKHDSNTKNSSTSDGKHASMKILIEYGRTNTNTANEAAATIVNPAVSAELEDSDDEDMTAARMDALTLEGEAGNSEEDEALLLRYEKYLDEVEKKSSGGNDDAIANEDAEQKRKLTNRRVSQWSVRTDEEDDFYKVTPSPATTGHTPVKATNQTDTMGSIGQDMMKRLLLHDQLTVQMQAGNVFQGFTESEINFRPTYKFDPDSEQYYTPLKKRKDRAPAWCDRILFKPCPKKKIDVLKYHAFHGLYHSDHRPVFGLFDFNI